VSLSSLYRASQSSEWEVPRLWRSEFLNALIGMTRARLLPADYVFTLANDVERTMVNHERAFPDTALSPDTFLRD